MNDINFLISSLRGGGAERIAVQLCNSWSGAGKQVMLISFSGASDDDYTLNSSVARHAMDQEAQSGSPISGLINNFRRVFELRKILKQQPAKVVVGFSGTSNISLILASIGLPHKVVVAERNYPLYSMRPGLWQRLRKYLYRFADCVVVQSNTSANWIMSNTNAKKTAVIPNAIVWPLVEGEPTVPVTQHVQPHQKLLLAVGNIHRQKGFDLLLQAAQQPLQANPDWQLVIAGAGGHSELATQAEHLAITKQVSFIGKVGNIGHWYERADAFVMSSRYEGFPNALLEAMASACAVVSFDCLTGPSEMIEHGKNGLLVEAENVNALCEQLNTLMRNEALRSELGQTAALVQTTFSLENILQRWSDMFEQLDRGRP